MPNTLTSTNMGMPVPIPGVETGPQWSLDINSCFAILDAHDHTPGYGAPITPGGLNISSDLTFGSNNAIDLRSVRFDSQTAVLGLAADLGCLYVVSDDLYYNDGAGNNVRITQSGGVAGSPGSISNLSSPASAAYVALNSTFVWQSAANTPANMDAASYILRNLSASSAGLTLNPPAAMGADYALTLPPLPASQKFMTLDATGAMSAPWAVDGSTIEVSSNTVQVKNGGITGPKLASNSVDTANIVAGAVTPVKLSASTLQTSVYVTGSTTSNTYVTLVSCSITITTIGRPVFVMLQPDPNGAGTLRGSTTSSADNLDVRFRIIRDGASVGEVALKMVANGSAILDTSIPCSSLSIIDPTPTATTHVYELQYKAGASSVAYVNGVGMNGYQL